jgi:hypothetical protein
MTSKSFKGVLGTARNALAPLSVALVVGLAGCASSGDDAVALSSRTGGPIETGTYPNLNIQPVAAAPQLTESERAAKTAELEAARRRVAATRGVASPDQRRLRRLAATHDEEALRRIEGE